MLDSGMRAHMKIFVPFLVLLAAVGCRTGEFRPGQATLSGVNGKVESWNGRDWVAERGTQVISDGARVRTDANTTADLSSGDSLTLRSSGADWMESGLSSALPGQHEIATRTVLEVEQGCVLVSVGEMPLNSQFEIRGGEVFAQVRGAECSTGDRGTVALVAGQVCLAAGEKSSVLRERASVDGKKGRDSTLATSRGPWVELLSPYERGLERARHGVN
jgi:hypothetical protein